ncbi:hypothetical protein HK405_014814 [Cladochytrium tenue]|nr:hypothetical protein HK405_014814 [Cladochytrium tenue]
MAFKNPFASNSPARGVTTTIAKDTEPINKTFRDHATMHIQSNLDGAAPPPFREVPKRITGPDGASRPPPLPSRDLPSSYRPTPNPPPLAAAAAAVAPSALARAPSATSSSTAAVAASAIAKSAFAPRAAVGPPAPPTARRPGRTVVVATADFEGAEDGDLAFRVGDLISVLEDVDENWYRGELRGKQGIFPKNYVQSK